MTDRTRRRATWPVTALLALATFAATWGLSPVVTTRSWPRDTAAALVLVAVAVAATRALAVGRADTTSRLRSVTPTLVGALVGAWIVLARFAGPTGRTDLFVGLESFGRASDRFGAALDAIAGSVAPVQGTLPVAMLVVAASVALFLVADLIAVPGRRPALASVPVLVLWIPSLVLAERVPTATFVGTVACLVLVLAADRGTRSGTRSARAVAAGSAVAATAAVTALALAAGGASATLPRFVAASWSDAFTDPGPGMQLSDDLDMQQDLESRSTYPVLSYTLEDSDAYDGVLRVYTLTSFDGTRWHRDDRAEGTSFAADEVLWPQASPDKGQSTTMAVTLAGYRDSIVPIPIEPRAVDIAGTWSYEPRSDELRGDDTTDPGMGYTVEVSPRDLTPESLGRTRGDDLSESRYLDVPQTSHTEDVAAEALAVTAGATTRFEQAVALQEYFRDTSRFRYDTAVAPAASDDAVWDFLTDRSGYCVQYATSMTVMARALGIPARVGVGYLPGQVQRDGSYLVSAQRAHAWPELYFPGSGWVRFEPTPSQRTGAAPEYTLEQTTGTTPATAAPQEVPDLAQQPAPAPVATATSAPVAAPAAGGRDETPWLLCLVLASTLTVGAGLALVAVLRSRRRATADRDVEDVWDALGGDLARLGVGWSAATTPRQVPDHVLRAASRDGTVTIADDAADALRELATLVEGARYAREGSQRPVAEADALAARVVAGTTRLRDDRRARVEV
ncbi:transglutaminase superfamily protein [Sediminihabitans luteus]|uniref:Transglutaminase superfamily protein n=1 Tax=Sediminihabitans luteus TaxID=1138585 RepID=A0A2M9CCP1_9CELL|nr:DUF3488 and transglutaminase-like domain-containing protein [Sediminihabitans luteus]PJJ69071.1 transglutaminase superfamily protein [Sediminihabitans luteus]GII99457.1 hypothetical protein Slu03_18350 [Sediminihabitans luteus]